MTKAPDEDDGSRSKNFFGTPDIKTPDLEAPDFRIPSFGIPDIRFLPSRPNNLGLSSLWIIIY